MAKATITQRDFSLGEVMQGFLEAKDLKLRAASVRRGLNAKVTASRTLRNRPGTFYVMRTDARQAQEIRPATGQVFALLIEDGSFRVIDAGGRAVYANEAAPWADGSSVWIVPFREETVMGGPEGIHVLTYSATGWSFAAFAFDSAPGGELAQPYWAFEKDITVRPTGRTGTINLEASRGIFTATHVGTRGRYNGREVTITGYVSPTNVQATVVSELLPSYRITVASGKDFRVGDVVTGEDTNFQGIVVAVSGANVDVATIRFSEGPDVSENLTSSIGASAVSAKVEISPLASPLWDEQLISPVRGYPRAAASAGGRLVFIDFPQVPDLIAMSSARGTRDFKVGADDDDGIARQVGDNAPRFLHVVNAGDILLFSDRGCYYVPVRDNGAVTPSNFNAVLFDARAASPIKPVQMDDGVLFVEASGESIGAALLDGNVYLKWSVRTISIFHNHLIKTPVALCGPSLFSGEPEKYAFIVNGDGTMAVMSWYADFDMESVGFLPWETAGSFLSLAPIFGSYWALTERDIGGTDIRLLERFDDAAPMDCCVPGVGSGEFTVNGQAFTVNGDPFIVMLAGASEFEGATMFAATGGWNHGEFPVLAGGVTEAPIGATLGFPFDVRIKPWPAEHVESPRAGMLRCRPVRGAVSVLHTHDMRIRANATVKKFGGYAFGDFTEDQPPLHTRPYKFMVIGRRDNPDIEIFTEEPGRLEVLAITQEVTY